MAGTNNTIVAFVLLSLGLHAVLLVTTTDGQQTVSVPSHSGRMTVSLLTPTPKTEKPHPKQTVKAVAAAPVAPTTQPHTHTKQLAQNSDTQPHDQLSPSLAANKVKRELQARLQTQFEYPLLAVRHGWQGDVHWSFRILANGTLVNIQVARSSGYALLDRSAMEALRRVRQLSDSPHWLQGRHLDMTLPIRYQLHEG
jgi:protein TonB